LGHYQKSHIPTLGEADPPPITAEFGLAG
jgi:hypothetical protein